MKPNKIVGILVFIGVIGFGLYMLYMALPYLIMAASNILYLSGFFVFFILLLIAIFSFGKKLFK